LISNGFNKVLLPISIQSMTSLRSLIVAVVNLKNESFERRVLRFSKKMGSLSLSVALWK